MTAAVHKSTAEKFVKSPRQSRSRKTLKRILAAIAELLSEKDFERISMVEIAERAGVSVATLYTRFKDKRSLLSYLIAQLQEMQLAANAERFDPARWRGVPLEDRVAHLVEYLLAGCTVAAGLLRTLTARQMFERRTPAEVKREQAALEILVGWLMDGIETARGADSETAARMALSLVGSTVRSHLLIGATCGLSKEQLKRELVKAVCAYLAPGNRPPATAGSRADG